MTIGNVHSDPRADERGRPFWLPPGGWGNGLEASAWVALAAVAGVVGTVGGSPRLMAAPPPGRRIRQPSRRARLMLVDTIVLR